MESSYSNPLKTPKAKRSVRDIADLSSNAAELTDDYEIQTIPELNLISYTRIPMFAVGYGGFRSQDTIRKKVIEERLAGLLVIEHQMYVGYHRGKLINAHANCSLWAFSCAIADAARVLSQTTFDPFSYAEGGQTAKEIQ